MSELLNIRTIRKKSKPLYMDLKSFIGWAAFGILVGLVVGFISAVFGILLGKCTAFRMQNPQMILGLPFAGLVISWLYYHLGKKGDQGTNLVLNSVREEGAVPWYVAIRIFIATTLTHLFGGSAGREGAALQLGGSVSSTLARFLKMDHANHKTTIMCGMSAAFSALFGTPLAATIFSMEVVNVGEIYYSALVPCAFSSIVGAMVAKAMGVAPEIFHIIDVPEMSVVTFSKMALIAVCCALLSTVFCVVLHDAQHFFHKTFWNHYAAVFTAGTLIVLLTMIVRSTDYMGTGMHVIERAIEGEVRPEAFLLKIVFTALTLGSCFKGGEIVPSFYVGATFGCLAGQIIGLSPSLCASVAMVSVFCGVTNCPVSSLLIAAELFGFEGIYYFLIGVAVCYTLSGYYSLYSSQQIKFHKYRAVKKNR